MYTRKLIPLLFGIVFLTAAMAYGWKGGRGGLPVGGGSGFIDGGTVIRLATSTDSVGVGTSTPGSKLEVDGAVGLSDDGWIGLGSSAGRVVFDDQGPDQINIMDANISIGIDPPQAKFHIATGAGTIIRLENTTNDDTWNFASDTSPGFSIAGGGSKMFSIDRVTGNIGIGTAAAAPDAGLQVVGDVSISDKITQGTYVIRKHVALSGAADGVATNFFTITTADETGDADGGMYSVIVHLTAGEATAASGAVNTASVSLAAHWTRIMASAGTGANSAVVEISESASADEGSGGISAVTLTITETSEFVQQVLLDVDTSGGTFDGFAIVELVYSDFTTAPVIN